jgi:hypothetical protein
LLSNCRVNAQVQLRPRLSCGRSLLCFARSVPRAALQTSLHVAPLRPLAEVASVSAFRVRPQPSDGAVAFIENRLPRTIVFWLRRRGLSRRLPSRKPTGSFARSASPG